jgi:Cytochrome c554 and c-prime
MTKLTWWKWATMCVGIVLASLATLAAEPRGMSESETSPVVQDENKIQYQGSTSCERCHNNGNQDLQPLPTKYFVKYDEFTTWKQKDKHSLAYSNLLRPRGKRMATLLNADVTKFATGCIGCHGAGEAEQKNRGENNTFDMNEGVSCENCHGPSSQWYLTHADPRFRNKSTADREKIGMIDLRSPAAQSTQCLTCHIGNSEEGKVVTHEMYAAGHPPLPSIEVATFSDVIPRHWWLVGEKPSEKVRQAAGFVEGTKERTRLSLVGAVVALKTSMKLLSDETKVKDGSTIPGLTWPDYARFDCWSCHHDLKRESWRQARGYQAAPGRPPISEWPLTIVELAIARLSFDDPTAKVLLGELQGHQKAVLDESTARPYGRKVAMAAAAEKFAAWTDVLTKRLSSATYDEAVSARLLRTLVENAGEKLVDYDAARQIAWTIKILVADSGSKLTNRPAIEEVLKKFDASLKLELPAGRDFEIEDQLSKGLQVIGDYGPATFQQHLKELLALLPQV